MSEQIITKKCSHCKQIKPLITEFGKNRSREDGHRHACKICDRSYSAKYRQSKHGKSVRKNYAQSEKGQHVTCAAKVRFRKKHPNKAHEYIQVYRDRNPEKAKAHSAVYCALKTGKLPRPDSLKCTHCPEQARDYHHHSYAPKHHLDVIPLCKMCHIKTHSMS